MKFRCSRLMLRTAVASGLLIAPFGMHAATINAASCSFSSVSTAVASAARGDTVIVPAGSADWGGNKLTITHGITLQGAGVDTTKISQTRNASFIVVQPDSTAIANEEIVRIQGFTFD